MEKVLNIYKPISLTPLELIREFQKQNPVYKNVKMGYAGRLDPLAHGVSVILVGEECKKRDHYQGLDKEYTFEVLLGVATDAYDILGMVEQRKVQLPADISKKAKNEIKSFLGKRSQPFPPYSAKRVDGKALFQWSREGRLGEIQIPEKEVEIYSILLLEEYSLTSKELLNFVKKRINSLKGNFRQVEITQSWNEFIKLNPDLNFPALKLHAVVSSGTYIRSICHELGQRLATGAIALDIYRTRVGNYKVEESINLAP